MNNSHPTEIEIQDYVTDKSGFAQSMIVHIESCDHCLAEVKNYQALFSGIHQQGPPDFDFDLSALVISKLFQTKPRLSADRFIAGFLVVFVCSFVAIPVILFRQYILNMFSGISPFFVYAIIGSASIIMTYKRLEMYRKYQKQMHLLNFN